MRGSPSIAVLDGAVLIASRDSRGFVLWLAIDEPICARDRSRHLLHAVDSSHVLAWTQQQQRRRRKTWDALCGARTAPTWAPLSSDAAAVTILWPPRVAPLRAAGWERCVACFDLTPKRRPRSTVEPVEVAA